jgi:hypothetical protein
VRTSRIPLLCAAALLGLLQACATTDLKLRPGSVLPEAHATVPPALEDRLARAPLCCDSLATLPYRDLPVAGAPLRVRIDQDSPAFAFDGGRSYFAAFRLPVADRPLVIQVSSLPMRSAGLGALTGLGAPLVFRPAVFLVDDAFRVRRVLLADGPARRQCGAEGADTSVFELGFDVSDPPADASYLVIATTDSLRSTKGDRVCGWIQDGYSPVGRLEVRTVRLAIDDGPVGLLGWRDCIAPGANEPGLLEVLTQGPDTRGGYLALGTRQLHFVPRNATDAFARLDLPYERILNARIDPAGALVIVAAGIVADAAERHRFLAVRPAHAPEPAAGPGNPDFARAVGSKIRPDWRIETVGLVVQPWDARVEFRSTASREARGRIVDTAVGGGLVTAFPCGLCQTGACPPQAIAPCAALFSIGAAVGGLWATGKEMWHGGLAAADRTAPVGIAADAWRSAAGPVAASASGRFDQAALHACLLRNLAAAGAGGWHDQGRMARLQPLPPPGEAATAASQPDADRGERDARYLVRISVNAIALVDRGVPLRPMQATARPLQLVIDGDLKFIDRAGGPVREVPLSWQSEPVDASRWGAADTDEVAALLGRACAEYSKAALESSEKAWRRE